MAATPTSTAAQPNVAKCAGNARAEVEKWAKRALDKGIQGLREEFAELKRYVPPDMSKFIYILYIHDTNRTTF